MPEHEITIVKTGGVWTLTVDGEKAECRSFAALVAVLARMNL